MPSRKDAAAELAEMLVQKLVELRPSGAENYPLTLRRLAELADPAAAPELVLKASGKKKPFLERILLAKAKTLDAPVALAEDVDPLADSPLLLNFVLSLACSPAQPTCEVSKLKSKVPAKLKAPFEAAVRRRIAAHLLPDELEIVSVKKKQHLHPRSLPLPRPSEAVLAEQLLQKLTELRRQGGEHYPLPLAQLILRTRPGADPKLLKKAMALPLFAGNALLPLKKDTPIALESDREALLNSRLLLETVLKLARSNSPQACTVRDLTKNVITPLQESVQEAIHQAIEANRLPSTIGCIRYKKNLLLFLKSDVRPAGAAGPEPPLQPERGRPLPPPVLADAAVSRPAVDFAQSFDSAFRRLEQEAVMSNFVSLVDLRRAIPVDRQTFDAELRKLRLAGRFTLSAAEGRHGISPEQQAAGIREDGALLLYVSRKRT